jgi:hypothetical protein
VTRRAIDDVLDHSKSRLATRLVLIALASYANEQGFAWPGAVKLMRRSGLARSTVWLSINELLRTGEIRLHTGPVPGREHVVRSYTFLITVSGIGPLDDASANTVAGFGPLDNTDDGEVHTVAGFGPQVLASDLASDSYFEHQGSDLRTSGVRSTSPENPTPFQDSDKKKNRKGTVKNSDARVRESAADVAARRAETDVSGVDLKVEAEADVTPTAEEQQRLELVELARTELQPLREAGTLRALVSEAGWVETRDGGVSAWLGQLPAERLSDVLQRARDAAQS